MKEKIDHIEEMASMVKVTSNIGILVDKANRKEYLSYGKHKLKYRLDEGLVVMLSTKEQLESYKAYSKGLKEQILKDETKMFYEYENRTLIKENIAGTLLCDFVNCNFTELESIIEFIKKYSLTFLLGILEEIGFKETIKSLYSKKEYDTLISNIVTKYGEDIETIKANFISDIDYLYNIYNQENIKELTPYQRLYLLKYSNNKGKTIDYFDNSKVTVTLDDMSVYSQPMLGVKEKYAIEDITREKDNLILTPHILKSTDLKQILSIELAELVCIDKFPIKKCQNCDKYFVTTKRTDEIYCNNVYEDGKTCKEIGFLSVKKRLLKEDDVARLYRNTYQQKLLRVKRNPDNKKYADDLDFFRERYQQIKEEMSTGKMSKEDFKKWLLSVKKN